MGREGGMAVPISHEPNDLRLGRYFLKIISAQSLRGGKNPSPGTLQPPPYCISLKQIIRGPRKLIVAQSDFHVPL